MKTTRARRHDPAPGLPPATALAALSALANATLFFHLRALADAGLVITRQQGRYIHCKADFAWMKALVGFLTENGCGGSGECGV